MVVLLHSGIEQEYLPNIFVMSLFFMISGFVYVPEKYTHKQYIRKRFKRLMIPFWSLTAMYAVVEAARSITLGYGTLKNLLTFPVYMLYGSSILPPATHLTDMMSGYSYPYAMAYGRVFIASPSANHLWFLPALFTGSILFCILEEKTRKGPVPKVLALTALFAIAYFDSASGLFTQLPWGLGTGSFGAAWMLCGYWAKHYALPNKSKKTLLISGVSGAALALAAELKGSTGSALISSYYGPYGIWSLFLTFTGGIGGAWFVMLLMKNLDTFGPNRLKRVLSMVGKSSMNIYKYQMVFLFVFGYAFLQITGLKPQLDEWLLGFLPPTPVTTAFQVAESFAIIAVITFLNSRRNRL